MKKILASALLIGLLLGTASPVFAEVTGTAGNPDTMTGDQDTVTNSSIIASYTVTIPATLTVAKATDSNLFTPSLDTDGTVELTNLSADGAVMITATASDLTLTNPEVPGSPVDNETLTTKLLGGTVSVGDKETIFSLENDVNEVLNKQTIQVATDENSQNNLPGDYSGKIGFVFEYIPAEAGADGI